MRRARHWHLSLENIANVVLDRRDWLHRRGNRGTLHLTSYALFRITRGQSAGSAAGFRQPLASHAPPAALQADQRSRAVSVSFPHE